MTAGVEVEPSALEHAAWTAIQRTGARTVAFTLAGGSIRLVGAGPALLDQLAPAFAHLPPADPDGPADLTVLVWDSESTGTLLPTLGPTAAQVGRPVTPVVSADDRSFVFHAFEQAVSYLDRRRGVAVHAVADARRVPPWERACPLRAILTWWTLPMGRLLVHGAAVGGPEGSLLLAGPGGAGKSTTALACLGAGWGYLGDDYVLVAAGPHGAPEVWSVYGSAKLAPDHLARFPELLSPETPGALDPPDAKRVGWPGREDPTRLVAHAPLRAVVLPRVTDADHPTLTPAPASRSLLALAPPTMFQTAGDRRAIFAATRELVTRLPAHRLDLGGDTAGLPDLLAPLLADTGGDA